MAAPIGSGVRVRLNFDDSCRNIYESSVYKSFWFLVNIDRQKTIESLALELSNRFDISSDLRIELSLDGCFLPPWETTAILRDNDLLTVAAVEDDVSKKRSFGTAGQRSISSESSRQHQKKRKRAFEEQEEIVLVRTVAPPMEKKRRKEVKSVEEVSAECGIADDSLEKRRNRQKQDNCTESLDLSDCLHDRNSVQSSPGAVRSRSCHVICSDEGLTNGLPIEETKEADGVKRSNERRSSPFVVASTFPASAVEENGSGKNVLVSNEVDEAESRLNEVGLDVKDSPDEVTKKSKRTRRSRKNRKEKNAALLEPELKLSSHSIVSLQSLDSSSTDVQRRTTFQWQNADLSWSKAAAKSHPQHIIFDEADSSAAAVEQNFIKDDVADHLPIHNSAAETICEGPVSNKEDVSRPDKNLSGFEPKWNSQTVFPYDKQLNETKHNGGSLLERVAGVDRGSRGGLSHDQKQRQKLAATDLGPFTNVQVFKRQRGAKFQSLRSTTQPVLSNKGDNFPAQKYIKRQATEDIPDVTASETMKDYSVYELLLGPPRPGDVIAYKILQLSADYSPVLSSYKEAKVQKFVPSTRVVELEPKNLQIPGQLKKPTGRFDLTIEDEHEILTNSVIQDDQLISISWDLLLEPRLVA